MPKYGLVGPGYLGRSSNINADRMINFYAEVESQDSKSVTALIGTPGFTLWVDTTLGPVRGMHVFNDLIYIVAGGSLYSVDSAKTILGPLATLATSDGRVVMADNGLYPTGGNQLAIADGSQIYIYSGGESVAINISAYTICFLGGYFIADIGGSKFGVSGLYDGSTWNVLDQSSADSSSDDLLAVFNNHGELWLIKQYTIEPWYPDGSAYVHFARIAGSVMDYGCAARYSVAQGSNTMFWLANIRHNNVGEFYGVCMANGYSVQKISTPALDYQISHYAITSDAFGYFRSDEGHEFYVLTFPTANATWQYDTTTGLWNELSTYTDSPYTIGRHIGNCHVSFNGKHYIGDWNSGKIYELSNSYYTDNGFPIVSIRTAGHISDKDDLKNVFIRKLQIDMETGIGDSAAPVDTGIYLGVVNTAKSYPMVTVGTQLWSVLTNNIYIFDSTTYALIYTISNPAYTLESIIYAFGSIWITDSGFYSSVYRIDPATRLVTNTISIATGPMSLASDGVSVWVGDKLKYAYKIDPLTNTVSATVTIGTSVLHTLAYGRPYIYAANYAQGTVSKINVTSNTVEATIATGTHPYGISADLNNVYVANRDSNTISKIDIFTNAITTINMTKPYILADDGNNIWSIDASVSYHNISKISKTTNAVIGSVLLPYTPIGLYYDGNFLLVPSTGGLLKVDIRQYPTSTDPHAVLSWSDDGGHTWSNDYAASIGKQGTYKTRLTWWRIGKSRDKTLRIAISDAIKKVLLSVYMNIEKGMS